MIPSLSPPTRQLPLDRQEALPLPGAPGLAQRPGYQPPDSSHGLSVFNGKSARSRMFRETRVNLWTTAVAKSSVSTTDRGLSPDHSPQSFAIATSMPTIRSAKLNSRPRSSWKASRRRPHLHVSSRSRLCGTRRSSERSYRAKWFRPIQETRSRRNPLSSFLSRSDIRVQEIPGSVAHKLVSRPVSRSRSISKSSNFGPPRRYSLRSGLWAVRAR